MTVLIAVFLVVGCAFILLGVFGILRLPDFYTRLHAMGKCDTLGVACIFIAMAIHEGLTLTSAKILAIGLFMAVANPAATHALGRAAWRAGLKPWTKEKS